ncbi:uncharacterized protein LOC110993701 [Pieris rapae]|uniref:uncharacterized protein LOC110993701 n=1 Tax=Pieris rapae TaxID=64459 RepID=UPI001E27B43C|nr:uncharacterized protein LOC110993701 [Pieris rapae]
MIRYICLLAIAGSAKAQNDESSLDSIFMSSNNNKKSIEDLKCSKIEPTDGSVWQGCYDCFTCDHPRFLQHSKANSHTRRLIVDDNCAPLEVCCVNQNEVTSLRGLGKCGISNPEGEPRSVRPTLRSVLPGQYPWRAWLYAEDTKLCPVSYIHFYPEVLVTTATCLTHVTNMEDNLSVRFERNPSREANIASFKIHPNFDHEKHDIALLKLETPVNFSRPVCRPEGKPEVGTTCVAVTRDDITITAVIPPQNQCNNIEGTMCALVPRHDFIPEPASGLFCADQSQQVEKYFLHGIMLSNTENVITYTQISDYDKWITDEINVWRI